VAEVEEWGEAVEAVLGKPPFTSADIDLFVALPQGRGFGTFLMGTHEEFRDAGYNLKGHLINLRKIVDKYN
jgi:hypothetical protein